MINVRQCDAMTNMCFHCLCAALWTLARLPWRHHSSSLLPQSLRSLLRPRCWPLRSSSQSRSSKRPRPPTSPRQPLRRPLSSAPRSPLPPPSSRRHGTLTCNRVPPRLRWTARLPAVYLHPCCQTTASGRSLDTSFMMQRCNIAAQATDGRWLYIEPLGYELRGAARHPAVSAARRRRQPPNVGLQHTAQVMHVNCLDRAVQDGTNDINHSTARALLQPASSAIRLMAELAAAKPQCTMHHVLCSTVRSMAAQCC